MRQAPYGETHVIVCDRQAFRRARPQPESRPAWNDGPDPNASAFEWATSKLEPVKWESITILGKGWPSRCIEAILDIVLKDSQELLFDIHIDSAVISASLFDRLTCAAESVTLVKCRLAAGWWRTNPSRRASRISMEECQAAAPPRCLLLGAAAWPALDSVQVGDGWDSPELHPPQKGRQASSPQGIPGVASRVVQALWHNGLDSLRVPSCSDIRWLEALPPLLELKTIELPDCPASSETLVWLAQHSKLQNFELSWRENEIMDWSLLKRRKGYGLITLTDAFLTDDDLLCIQQNLTASTVQAYYSRLTARSWKTILEWRGLKSFWASTELFDGNVPDDLPEETGLKEVVALNAHYDKYRSFLARYPKVRLVEM